MGSRVARDQPGERTARLSGDVGKGSERSGCEERIACTFEDSATSRGVRAEATDESGLADARLTGDQYQAPGSVLDLMEGLQQRLEERFALEERPGRDCAHR